MNSTMSGLNVHPTNSSKTIQTTAVKKCNMTCVNNGVCKLGQGQYGFNIVIQDEDPNPISKQTRLFEQYCDCPTGYTGFNCEIKMVLCSNGQQYCANGAKCHADYADSGNRYYHCGCDAQHSNLTASYATQFCQQAAGIVFCATQTSFCTNGGTCLDASQSVSNVKTQASGLKGPQCQCVAGWEGPHCEFPAGTIPGNTGFDPNPTQKFGLAVAGITFVIIVLLSVFGIRYMHLRRKSPPTKSAASGMSLEENGSDTMPVPPAFLSTTITSGRSAVNINMTDLNDIHALDDDEQSTTSTRKRAKEIV